MFIGLLGGSKEAQKSMAKFQENALPEKVCSRQIWKEILVPFCFQGTCNTELFNLWVEQFLCLALKPSQVVILDNAIFHKFEKTKELIEVPCFSYPLILLISIL
jgi:hypothetical protein